MFYAGIGSRKTPASVLTMMREYAVELSKQGYTLRSGGAPGADSAFEAGAVAKEIYIPWNGFNGRNTTDCLCIGGVQFMRAMEMASQYHPAWHHCSPGARKLHARNCLQILGKDLATPVEFVICWTKGALRGGGTGLALRIAEDLDIPIYDLASEEQHDRLDARLGRIAA